MGDKVLRSTESLKKAFNRHYQSLKNDCSVFDSDNFEKAFEIASKLRVFLYDTGMQKSLIQQMINQKLVIFCNKDDILFSNTVTTTFSPRNIGIDNSWPLLSNYIGGQIKAHENSLTGFSIRPKCLSPNEKIRLEKNIINFSDWWNGFIYFNINPDNQLTRKDLIITVANEDGAHVDSKLTNWYERLHEQNKLLGDNNKTVILINGQESPSDMIYLSIRQIGYELLDTLQREFSDFITDKSRSWQAFTKATITITV